MFYYFYIYVNNYSDNIPLVRKCIVRIIAFSYSGHNRHLLYKSTPKRYIVR